MQKEINPRALEAADRLHSLAIHLLRRLRVADAKSGIGPAQLSALSVLVFGGGPRSLGGLAEAEQVTPATMSRLVTAMTSAGLVKRETPDRDRRRVLLTPTARGRKVLQEARERRVERLASALACLSENDMLELEQATRLLQAVLQKL